MPQSLACLHVHLVFSTKNRRRDLHDEVREALDAYMATVLRNLGCGAAFVRSVEDHVHILFDLPRTISISDAVKEVKTASSKWLKEQGRGLQAFAWQAGYGAFSVSESNVPAVRDYIAHQEEHHRTTTFQDEYRMLLQRHRIEFDDRYVWD